MPDEIAAAIAADLGITDLPIEEQQTLVAEFGEIALKAATLSVLGRLSGAARDEFAELAQAGDAPALKSFLDREVPEHEDIVKVVIAEEVRKFKILQNS